MLYRAFFLGFLLLVTCGSVAAAGGVCPETLDFKRRFLASNEQIHLCERYAGKVVLVVNTASKCAYTPQYNGLESLYRRYRERGLVVLGFPSNDFGAQEPGTEPQIQNFCQLTYKVDFPMFAKTRVTSSDADPIYKVLARQGGGYPRWNFHKYLLDRQGRVVASFPSRMKPEDPRLIRAIEDLL